MKPKLALAVAAFLSVVFACLAYAQDLPSNIRKIKDGIYVYVGTKFNSNVPTQEGVVLAKQGKSLDEIKKELKMPEYAHWASQERFPTNAEAAYKVVMGK
jgi:hypothetical protein